MKTWALITGATSGIGYATALLLAKHNYSLILTGRRLQKLKELQKRIQSQHDVSAEILNFDISNRRACEEQFKEHHDLLKSVSVLINNAGLARGIEKMNEASLDDWESMIDTNIKGLLFVSRLMLPYLINNQPSHIINLGSVAGRWTYPGGGVYCSTKFAVRALTEGMRLDLLGKDIRITNISPGMVETEFSEVRFQDKHKAKKVYEGLTPLSANDIAESILWSLQRPKHVNIQEMVIYPTAQASVSHVHRCPALFEDEVR